MKLSTFVRNESSFGLTTRFEFVGCEVCQCELAVNAQDSAQPTVLKLSCINLQECFLTGGVWVDQGVPCHDSFDENNAGSSPLSAFAMHGFL